MSRERGIPQSCPLDEDMPRKPLINGILPKHNKVRGIDNAFYQFPLITFLYPWHDINHKDSPYPIQTIYGTADRL